MAAPEALPEPRLNALLRQVDWRFLLHCEEAPKLAPIGLGAGAATRLIAAEAPAAKGEADLAVIGFPAASELATAIEYLRPGGEIVCVWRRPRSAAPRRAAERLRAAGLGEIRTVWPGPIPHRTPQFWLPLNSAEAGAHLLSERPPRSRPQALLRRFWRVLASAGLLAPAFAIGRLPGGGKDEEGPIEPLFPAAAGQLLLTGGGRSINKVVGLPFGAGAGPPGHVVKFARVAAADEALEREAAVLRSVELGSPGLEGLPRVLATGRRAGRLALAESAVHGSPLIAELSAENFDELAGRVTEWLLGLAGRAQPRPRQEWWQRLVAEPLAGFERDFGPALGDDVIVGLGDRLQRLGALPEVCEHRDCSPWNVVLAADGSPGLLDWESAEAHGLPCLDLAYFLANSAFVIDGALDSGRTRESYARLIDASSPVGRVAARRTEEYCRGVGVELAAFADLRLLCWVIHSRSDHRHLEMAAVGRPSAEALRGSLYAGLIETELRTTQV